MSVVDNIIVGKVGIEALAAVSITNALFAVIMVIGFVLTMAVIPLTAMTYGQVLPPSVYGHSWPSR